MKVKTTISIDFIYDDEEMTADGYQAVTEGGLREYLSEDRINSFLDYPESLEVTNVHIHTNSVEE